MANWKDEIARTITGERTELKTLPGYWIVPRKFSTGVAGQIKAIERNSAAASPVLSAAALKHAERSKDREGTDASVAKILDDVPLASRQQIMLEMAQAQVTYGPQLYALTIRGGIADHNFLADDGKKALIDDDFVAAVEENQVVADEMVAIIREWNGPFGRSGPARSGTPPSGSTAESR